MIEPMATPSRADSALRWVLALLSIVLTGAGSLAGAAPALAATSTYAYDTAAYTYDAPALLSSPDTAATNARGSPERPGAISWGRSASVRDDGDAAETAGEAGAAGETVFSGHGAFVEGSGKVTLPEGTSISTYAPHNSYITDAVGNQIELGNPPMPTRVFGPGETMPNYTLYPPGDLNIAGNPVTVGRATPLSELLKPNIGMCHWAACTEVIPGS